MADWLVEEGIAEHRAIRLDTDRIIEARIAWPGAVAAGWIVEATLTARAAGSDRGTALADSGEEVLVDRLARDLSEGARMRIEITRAAIHGPGRLKRAQGRVSTEPLRTMTLAQGLAASGARVSVTRRFPACDWDELIGDALDGEARFAGGALLFAPTAAMTTVDVDGTLAPRALALAAVPALADMLSRFDVGGSVVIDFPTLADKTDRRAVDTALAAALAEWPHERTAMNGFGLVQLVTRYERASLLQLAAWRRGAVIWRRLLRRAEMLAGPGPIELSMNPALEHAIAPGHLAELERRSGKRVRIHKVATLAVEAPHAQLAPDD